MILCYDQRGQAVSLAPEAIEFRLAGYGVLVENNQVLLWPNPATQLWQLPGGIAAKEQSLNQAVRQYFQEVTGVMPELGPLLLAEERYESDSEGRGYHLAVFYYAVERLTTSMAGLVDFDNPAAPEWIPVPTLERRQLQGGYDAIQIAYQRQRTE